MKRIKLRKVICGIGVITGMSLALTYKVGFADRAWGISLFIVGFLLFLISVYKLRMYNMVCCEGIHQGRAKVR